MLEIVNYLAPEEGWVRETIRKRLLWPKPPAYLAKKFIPLEETAAGQLRESLLKNSFASSTAEFLATPIGKLDFADHMTGRLERDRQNIVPWLDSVQRLEGLNILEIGCGTGASTVALAEQGARVTGLDIDTVALRDAANRCRIYGLDVTLVVGNASDVRRLFSPGQFELIIFYASLEHMTHRERMEALSDSWTLLPPGGVLAVIETPNRLWYFDSHTALAPFFHWLPDDVALKYAHLCPRENFSRRFSELDQTSHEELMRWGRGVSFHEFQLAIDDIDLRSSVSCSAQYTRRKRFFSWLKWTFSSDGTYERLLRKLRPDVHSGFFQPYLNVAVRKRVRTDQPHL